LQNSCSYNRFTRQLAGVLSNAGIRVIVQQLGKEFFELILNEAFGAIPQDVSGLAERLPKDLRNQGVYGLTTYLAQLGLLTPMQDHLLNMPDIYPIGFKLGRRGGIKPVPCTIAQPD
jgi:hypothetical protein